MTKVSIYKSCINLKQQSKLRKQKQKIFPNQKLYTRKQIQVINQVWDQVAIFQIKSSFTLHWYTYCRRDFAINSWIVIDNWHTQTPRVSTQHLVLIFLCISRRLMSVGRINSTFEVKSHRKKTEVYDKICFYVQCCYSTYTGNICTMSPQSQFVITQKTILSDLWELGHICIDECLLLLHQVHNDVSLIAATLSVHTDLDLLLIVATLSVQTDLSLIAATLSVNTDINCSHSINT